MTHFLCLAASSQPRTLANLPKISRVRRFARVSSSRNFLTANQSVHVNVTFFQILIFIDWLYIVQYQLHMVIYLIISKLFKRSPDLDRYVLFFLLCILSISLIFISDTRNSKPSTVWSHFALLCKLGYWPFQKLYSTPLKEEFCITT